MTDETDPIAGKHGTYAGWNAHNRFGIPRCDACKKAGAQYKRQRWRQSRCAPGLGWPLEAARRA